MLAFPGATERHFRFRWAAWLWAAAHALAGAEKVYELRDNVTGDYRAYWI